MTVTTMGIDHIGLTVANLEASTRFFTECLGWRVFGSNPAYPAAYVTDGTAKITLWQVADTTAFAAFDRKNTVGLHHLALKVPDRSSLDSIFERVRAYPASGQTAEEHNGRYHIARMLECAQQRPSKYRANGDNVDAGARVSPGIIDD